MWNHKGDLLVYDVEIAREVKDVPGGWSNPGGMGLGSAVVYDADRDFYHMMVGEDKATPLLRLLDGNTVITFNGIKFDSRVIAAEREVVFTADDLPFIHCLRSGWAWYEIDLLHVYIQHRFNLAPHEVQDKLDERGIHDRSFNLDTLCKVMLGHKKSGHGAHAPILFKQGKYDELLQYNLQDVKLTWKLFHKVSQDGQFTDGRQRVIEVDEPWVWPEG